MLSMGQDGIKTSELKRTNASSKKKNKNGLVPAFFLKMKKKISNSPTAQKLLEIRFVKYIVEKLCAILKPDRLKENFVQAFSIERSICRLITAWCFFVVSTLGEKDAFTNLEWLQETELSEVAGATIGFFLLFSLVAVLVGKCILGVVT